MKKMKKMSKRNACLVVALVAIVLLLVCEIVGFSKLVGVEGKLARSLDMTVTRA